MKTQLAQFDRLDGIDVLGDLQKKYFVGIPFDIKRSVLVEAAGVEALSRDETHKWCIAD
jgi:hypothetical protein